MAEYVDRLVEMLSQLEPGWTYALLFVSAFLENVVPPVPGDTVVVFSAYLVGRGTLEIWPVYLSTCAGGTLGFLAMFYLGFSRGRGFFTGPRRRVFNPDNLAKAERWLGRYGSFLILANRFLSGVRSVIAISAGIGGMNWQKVAICGAISIGVWNGLLLYAGLLVGQNWERVVHWIEQYNRFLVCGLGGMAALLIGRWWWRRKTKGGLTIY